ncbi:glycosyltransferase family 2 protein [Microaerobacter geothermalis]|uniref:glycosyltransferase family 2 protein n=1 Tax=Microaerobacter geothermalis TaxID=674972 RepID=UPI001F2E542D|nr:glycosyltransferase family 2 protein [Microaerobacter geothermalis]MCF6094428.1 glycosyltransferase family 2 protein [Microaerobacter geothermalis]
MNQLVSVIIPAFNESQFIGETLETLSKSPWVDEIIVVDDGSSDGTSKVAKRWTEHVVVHQKNQGKGKALMTGVDSSTGSILMFLDADLGESVQFASRLLAPIFDYEADMTIAVLPPAKNKGGFGLVKGLAEKSIYWLTGYKTKAPLSGQRALRKTLMESVSLVEGFGIEVGLTIDALRKGYRVSEIEVPFLHRETGRDLPGFIHRGKQFISISNTIGKKMMERIYD